MKTFANQIYPTKGDDGRPNGRIIRVWERGQAVLGYGPGQVYVTTLLPGCSKGPHCHRKRDSLFVCVRGTVRIITRTNNAILPQQFGDPVEYKYSYETITSGIGAAGELPIAVHVPAGTPCKLYNNSSEEAYVVNVSSEPYDPADEHEVEDWNPNGN